MTSKLNDRGYLLFKNFTSEKEWDKIILCPEGLVNYKKAKKQIANEIKKLNEKIGWDCQVSKYRVSPGCSHETSNATDAASFHRDVMAYTKHNVPIYTFIIYLDDAGFQFIPKSHKNLRMNMITYLSKRNTQLQLNPGDAILINATLLHRGVFNDITKNRRVIQLFDVFPNKKIALQYYPNIAHVVYDGDVDNTKNSLGETISKYAHSRYSSIIKFLSSMVTANGYGYNMFQTNHTIMSGESYRPRLTPDQEKTNAYFKGNLYVVYDHNYVNELDAETNKYYRSMIYGNIHIMYYLIRIILISELIWSIIYIYRAMKRS